MSLDIERVAKQLKQLAFATKFQETLEKYPDYENKLRSLSEEIAEGAVFRLPLSERLSKFEESLGAKMFKTLSDSPAFESLFKEWQKEEAVKLLKVFLGKFDETFPNHQLDHKQIVEFMGLVHSESVDGMLDGMK